MAAVGIRELKAKASDIIPRSSKGERFLVTRRRRPVSVLLPIDDDLEEFIRPTRVSSSACGLGAARVPRWEDDAMEQVTPRGDPRREASCRGASSSVAAQRERFGATRARREN